MSFLARRQAPSSRRPAVLITTHKRRIREYLARDYDAAEAYYRTVRHCYAQPAYQAVRQHYWQPA